jgi:hypothetical protein
MLDTFPVGMDAVEMHGMSVITFISLGFYSFGIFIGGAWFVSQLKYVNKRIDIIDAENDKMLSNLSVINTSTLVAIATLTEKVDNLERLLRNR